jgi:predicted nucleic acid-binding protein
VIFDTDVLIWVQRGNEKAAQLVDDASHRFVSILTYMELLQNAHNKKEHACTKDFLSTFGFTVLPLTEDIGHRAAIYIEEYSLSSGLRAADAIIAATATENNMLLATGNGKHFRPIKELRVKLFKP